LSERASAQGFFMSLIAERIPLRDVATYRPIAGTGGMRI
jgi:hypothetical protein